MKWWLVFPINLGRSRRQGAFRVKRSWSLFLPQKKQRERGEARERRIKLLRPPPAAGSDRKQERVGSSSGTRKDFCMKARCKFLLGQRKEDSHILSRTFNALEISGTKVTGQFSIHWLRGTAPKCLHRLPYNSIRRVQKQQPGCYP